MTRAYPRANLTRKHARTALMQLLYGCTLERLQNFTAAGLAATHNVPLATVEEMLLQARARRVG